MSPLSSNLSDLSDGASYLSRLTDEQQQRLSDVLERYLAALEQGTPLAQDELLARNPDLADALRSHFRSLDDLHRMAAGFSTRDQADSRPPDDAGDAKRIGDFKLLREIGRGGMGVVYEARQISLDRRVAVKLLPFAAVLDSKQIARFKNEAQAAAQVQHPNIVPVFAIGVERGVHYYAMQFIDGQPLDRAIEEIRSARARRAGSWPSRPAAVRAHESGHSAPSAEVGARNESSETRPDRPATTRPSLWSSASENRATYFNTVIQLGIQAAEALHAAHEYGVVHRDIKPSNLLVDSEGKLWVTDFGLARFHRDVSLTRTGDIVGTMRYMSPEQATGRSALVDHRTDVYSLGVTLYELLCLRPAFPEKNSVGLLRQLDHDEPPPPRRIQPDIPRDLETVILKAMAKSRDDRYLTAQQFADDLRCVREGKPTRARTPTVSERGFKWARRHRRAVATSVAGVLLGVVALVVGLVRIAEEKIRAEQNLERAEIYFRDARRLLDRFGGQLSERLSDVPGAEQVRRELLQESLAYYQNFVKDAQNDPNLRAEMALTFGRVASLTDSVGTTAEAVEAHERTVQAYTELAARQPDSLDVQRHLALSKNNLALALSRSGRTEEAAGRFSEAMQLQERLCREHPDDKSMVADWALTLSNLGLVQSETGQMASARSSFRSAIDLLKQQLTRSPADPDLEQKLAAALNNLAATHLESDPQEALKLHQESLHHQVAVSDARRADLPPRRDVALTLNNLGAACARLRQFDDAIGHHLQAIGIQEELARQAPAHRVYQRDLAVSHNNLGLIYSRADRTMEAEQEFRRALTIHERLIQEHSDDLALQSSLGGVQNNLGILLEEAGQLDSAVEAFTQAIAHQRIAVDHAPDVARYREFLNRHYVNLGRVLRALGRLDRAVQAAQSRRELWPKKAEHLFGVAAELAQVYERIPETASGTLSLDRCAQLVVDALQQAQGVGWDPPADLAQRPHFSALSKSPRFVEWIARAR